MNPYPSFRWFHFHSVESFPTVHPEWLNDRWMNSVSWWSATIDSHVTCFHAEVISFSHVQFFLPDWYFVLVVVVVSLCHVNKCTHSPAGFDILVKNCIAHNGAQQRLQLIDPNGWVWMNIALKSLRDKHENHWLLPPVSHSFRPFTPHSLRFPSFCWCCSPHEWISHHLTSAVASFTPLSIFHCYFFSPFLLVVFVLRCQCLWWKRE